MGIYGKDRVFILKPRGIDLHLPSDLLGFTTIEYNSARTGEIDNIQAALTPAAVKIRVAIGRSTWSRLKLNIKLVVSQDLKAIYPLKVVFRIRNPHLYPVTIKSLDFKIDPDLRFSLKTEEHKQKPLFLQIGFGYVNHHTYSEQVTIEKETSAVFCWIGIDPTIDISVVQKAIDEKKIGVWAYRCIWLMEHVIVCNYEDAL